MTQTYLPTATLNAQCEAAYPAATISHTATATNGTTTLTFTTSESYSIFVGMTLTGAGITGSGTVTGVNNSTGVVTISGTISTLTTTSYVFTNPIYVGLNTTTPGFTGANEVSGGSYVRQSAAFGAPSTGVKSSTGALSWTNMPSVTIGYFSLWTASTSGTNSGNGALTSSLTVPSGATVTAAIGAITLTQSG
jgi:hypothetical protein